MDLKLIKVIWVGSIFVRQRHRNICHHMNKAHTVKESEKKRKPKAEYWEENAMGGQRVKFWQSKSGHRGRKKTFKKDPQ